MDAKIQSFRNTATGAKELEQFFIDMGTFGVSDEASQALQKAIKDNELVEAIRLFGETRNELGDEFSNFAGRIGLSALGNLETGFQYEDWISAWDKGAMRVNEVNLKGLNDLENGYADIKFAMAGITKWLGSEMGGNMSDLGDAVLKLTNRFLEWVDTFKLDPKAQKVISSTAELLSIDEGFASGEKSGVEAMIDGLKSGGEWVKNLRDFIIPPPTKEGVNFDPTNFGAGFNQIGNADMSLFGQPKDTQINVETMNVTTADAESFIQYDLNDEIAGL